MPNYLRARKSGGTFFFTVVTYRRRLLFDNADARRILRDVIAYVRARHPFTIDAWVLLPEHMHCIWTLPQDISDFSTRWGLIKTGFSKRVGSLFHIGEGMSASREKHRELTLWQRRFWEHQIRDDEEYQAYMDYIHFNPVKHGWVARVADWPHSTFHRYVRLGVYPEDWGGVKDDSFELACGE